MLPLFSGGHAAYQDTLVSQFLKFYPEPFSITRWVALLKENPLYAILSGFPFGDTSGIGTFYDFFLRLWDADSSQLSPKVRFPKPKTCLLVYF